MTDDANWWRGPSANSELERRKGLKFIGKLWKKTTSRNPVAGAMAASKVTVATRRDKDYQRQKGSRKKLLRRKYAAYKAMNKSLASAKRKSQGLGMKETEREGCTSMKEANGPLEAAEAGERGETGGKKIKDDLIDVVAKASDRSERRIKKLFSNDGEEVRAHKRRSS